MKKTPSRTGSAILVVLGMTAFLLVSAIAFSAYVRSARMPSSYLRRTSASRLLAKAAVARAIDAVDIAVNNNPHPNVGNLTVAGMRYDLQPVRNVWHHRVLMGTNTTFSTAKIDPATVSPLCLEALAYIPPPLVNEARFFSRVTPTARWHALDFDVGRYAFCALDVSDYFDVNRMMADVPRSSAANRRVTLGYLFESDRHQAAGSAAAWDRFMEKFREIDEETLAVTHTGSKMPLVSMADYSLALGQQGGVGSFKSPFYEFISRGGGGAGFYNTTSETDEDYLRRQTFVTDGWFPEREEEDEDGVIERFDLGDGRYQPFAREFLETERPALSDVVLGKRLQADGDMKWLEHLSGLGCAALYDYLDPDHVPISLAVPTTERVPMICGVETTFPNAKFAVQRLTEPESGNEDDAVVTGNEIERTVRMTVKYRIDSSKLTPGFMGGVVKSLVVFPFAHKDPADGAFALDGRFTMFLASEQMTLRTGEANDELHLKTPMIGNTALDAEKGLMNVKLEDYPVSFTEKVAAEDQAVKEVELRLNAQAMGTYFSQSGNELLSVTYEWKQTHPMVGGVLDKNSWTPRFAQVLGQGGDYISAAHCGIKTLKANGTVDERCTDAKLLEILRGGPEAGLDVTLNAAVWLRVKDKNGKVVDMVPACLSDDKLQNQVNDPDPRMAVVGKQEFAGQPYPVFRLDTGVGFKLSVKELDALTDLEVKISPEAAIVADPRYNHAPEHWFALAGRLTKENWLNGNHTGEGGRDCDLFMATSDAGYMQSPHEVAHLPRLTNLVKYGGSVSAGNMEAPDGTALAAIPATFAEARNSHLAWRTFDPIDADADAFYDLPWTAAGRGFKVNPYSDSTNILMAAFANTPIDWKHASTNDVEGAESYYDMSLENFNRKYAFNAYSEDTKIAWRDLERIAGRFGEEVRSSGNDWQDALAKLGDWTSRDPDRLCGVALDSETDTLWDADRKFLYGFWSDCFAVRQQLYMVFVRAEPVMMGSGAAGQIPPQLGARAMALVWRDPRPAKDANAPHQTRILFYRQFE